MSVRGSGGQGPAGSAAALVWENVEAVNAKLEQTITIQVAVLNGLVFLRGLGKVSAEIAINGVLFTIPLAGRPATERIILYATNSVGTTTAALKIKTNGEVLTSAAVAAAKTPPFDGLVFSL